MIFDRTFHPDEANQAFTTGRLLETGVYRYDPKDHHGPTLYYAAAAIQKAAGNGSTATLDATLLRCTPLVFAVLALAFGFLGLRKILKKASPGRAVLLPGAFVLLLATSPVFAFFATDFIQEMLLAAFTAAMFWSATGYALRRGASGKVKPGTWLLLTGIAAGLAFATKETCAFTFAAAAAAAATGIALRRRNAPESAAGPGPRGQTASHAVLAAAGFALTSILFYSSFGENLQGVYSAFVEAPLSYLKRAAGDAASEGAAYHVHPWWTYLKWLFASNACFAAFAAAGTVCGVLSLARSVGKRGSALSATGIAFASALAYAVTITVLYSLVPYKTPWCALQLHLPVLLAGFLGFAACAAGSRTGLLAGAVFSCALLAENGVLLSRMWRDPDSREIPYNYAAASPQVKEMAELVKEVTREKKESAFVAVAVPAEDTWPLPFYLRDARARVGYWTQFEELEVLAALKRLPDAVIVPAEQGHLVRPLFPHLKNTKRFEMRHRVRIRVFW